MEPVRGGKLATLPADSETALKAMRPDESIPAWCFRWLQGIENVTMVLSGMSNTAQMVDNVKTFEAPAPLTAAENAAVMAAAESLKNSVPCTACRYCCDGCPMELDIPLLLGFYNDLRVTPSFLLGMRLEALPPEKLPSACVGCGACARVCPQNIDIPAALVDMANILKSLPSWEAICREREATSKKK
jgi:predicted aldo/keto reductase-like oxidoreductase